ncbi:uncharacterized protein ARMOST_15606 [Armillaria ostoyae]|uniref:Uncharacterized protein n=1 Tax=Armillaria ostoyae TaxID=47428 RepID=A0A284RTU9_ARMOS|nr:uncharacterized protein ARMOST_15606 [Armillaria ostoyae]
MSINFVKTRSIEPLFITATVTRGIHFCHNDPGVIPGHIVAPFKLFFDLHQKLLGVYAGLHIYLDLGNS